MAQCYSNTSHASIYAEQDEKLLTKQKMIRVNEVGCVDGMCMNVVCLTCTVHCLLLFLINIFKN